MTAITIFELEKIIKEERLDDLKEFIPHIKGLMRLSIQKFRLQGPNLFHHVPHISRWIRLVLVEFFSIFCS